MRVEILEKQLKSSDPETGVRYNLVEGDTITVPDEVGERWCAEGWAKDVDGKVETGKRIVRGRRLDVESAKHKNTSKKVGG